MLLLAGRSSLTPLSYCFPQEVVTTITALREEAGIDEIYPRQSNSSEYPYIVNFSIPGITQEMCNDFTRQLQLIDSKANIRAVLRKQRNHQVQLTVGQLATFYEISNRDIKSVRFCTTHTPRRPPSAVTAGF
jgi:hypothetical protein